MLFQLSIELGNGIVVYATVVCAHSADQEFLRTALVQGTASVCESC
jgi:hypothetical protein